MHTIKQITDVSQLGGKIVANGIVMNGTNADLALPTGGGYGAITSWEGNKTYDSFKKAGELNWVNKFGALLWMDPDNGRLIANNAGKSQEWDPKSETASIPEAPIPGYILIGVCVGLGKWVYYIADSPTRQGTCAWANGGSDRYKDLITEAIHTDGWTATNAILKHTDTEDTPTTLFNLVKALRDSTSIPVFVPSKLELAEMQNNCCSAAHTSTGTCSYNDNIGTLLSLSADYGYWSSSQAPDSSNCAFYVDFDDGYVGFINKDLTVYRAVLFLHFGEV